MRFPCRTCKGSGALTEKETHKSLNNRTEPIRDVDCPECRGACALEYECYVCGEKTATLSFREALYCGTGCLQDDCYLAHMVDLNRAGAVVAFACELERLAEQLQEQARERRSA